MTTIASCSNIAEAQFLKSLLEGAGITAFLPDELTATTAPQMLFAVGVRVQVEDEDAAQARRVIEPPRASS
jgi:hypothetical protein